MAQVHLWFGAVDRHVLNCRFPNVERIIQFCGQMRVSIGEHGLVWRMWAIRNSIVGCKKKAGAVVAGHGREESILSCSWHRDNACVKRRGLDWTPPASSPGPNHLLESDIKCGLDPKGCDSSDRGVWSSVCQVVQRMQGRRRGGKKKEKKEGRSPTRRDNAASRCAYSAVDYYYSQFSRNRRSKGDAENGGVVISSFSPFNFTFGFNRFWLQALRLRTKSRDEISSRKPD